jgi:tetratricopeptide (TPR) repeat protein
MRKELAVLDNIFDKIPINPVEAKALLDGFIMQYGKSRHHFLVARTNLVSLAIAAATNTYHQQKTDDKKLLRYFEKQKHHNQAALLLITRARHLFHIGNIPEAEKCITRIREAHLPYLDPETEVGYLYFEAHLYATRGEFAQRLFIGMQAMEKLEATETRNNWGYSNYVNICTVIADVYQRNNQFNEAWTYLQKGLKAAESQNLSPQLKFTIYRYVALYYNFTTQTEKSIEWYQKALDQLNGDDNLTLLIVVNSNIAVQYYWLFRETSPAQKAKRQKLLQKMEQHAEVIEKYNCKLKSEVHGANLLMLRARIATLREKYEEAIQLMDKALPVFKKLNHDRSILEYYQLSHKAWQAWAQQTQSVERMSKAYDLLMEHKNRVVDDSKKEIQQKLDSVRNAYELQQQKLKEQLMKQEIDSLNKEMQLTSLNLHDKIMVLDEVKAHVQTMKRKGLEINQLSKSILQKIDTVKITEQEKNRLQDKLGESNKVFGKLLQEKHPSLTNMEVSMCGLFKTGMTDKELAKLYGQSYKSYEQHRFRIKKKMKLGKVGLVKYLQGLEN